MNLSRNLIMINVAILFASSPVSAATVFVQHLGDVHQGSAITFATGLGYNLSANLFTGHFKVLADASPTVPVNNNFAGTFQPVEFTNTTGATIIIPAGTPAKHLVGQIGLVGRVQADLIAGPPAGAATGGSPNTNMRVSGNMFVRILGGTGQGDFSAIGFYQETVIYNMDGTVRQFIPDSSTTERGGTHVLLGGGAGISVNMDLLMPELVLDPGARLQVSFTLQGDASDSSTTDAYNTAELFLTLPAGVTLANDVGEPLAWVTNAAAVPEPSSLAMIAIGLGVIAARARRRRPLQVARELVEHA